MKKQPSRDLHAAREKAEEAAAALNKHASFEEIVNYVQLRASDKIHELAHKNHSGNQIYTVQGEARILSEILDILRHKGK